MFIIVGWRSRYCDDATGYMYCPACRSRKPAAQGVRKTYLTTFFIPLFPLAEHEGYYRCEGCQGVFDPDARWPYDFGNHPSPKLWSCSHCRSSNPSHSYRCQTCGADA
ncbi:MAG TPA: zinc-ribbon domain-containing protein [Gemmataceae bacterium]|nr:zinc-ribbon domain-containing protein [Gemmataceae bacterium]